MSNFPPFSFYKVFSYENCVPLINFLILAYESLIRLVESSP